MRKTTQLFAAAAALTLALAGASQASASTVYISADHLYTSAYTVVLGGTVDGNPFSANVFESPDVLTVSIDNGAPQDILAFCVDIFHNFNSSTPPVTYVTSPVTNNSDSANSGGGPALSNVISGELGFLADLGKITSDPERMAGIQGAVWKTEYAGLTLSGGSSYVDYYAGLASAWGAAHPNFAGYANGIYATNGQTQGFGATQGFTTGGVPEPATWALMLSGFGLAGAALRRGRTYRLVEISPFRAPDDHTALSRALCVAEGAAIELWRGAKLLQRHRGQGAAA